MKKQPDSQHLFLRRQKKVATNTLWFYTSRLEDIYYFHSVLRDGFEIWSGVQRAVWIHLSPEFPRVNETPYFQNWVTTATIFRCVYAKVYFVEKLLSFFISDFEVYSGASKTSKIYPEFSNFNYLHITMKTISTSLHCNDHFSFTSSMHQCKRSPIKYGNYNQGFKTF